MENFRKVVHIGTTEEDNRFARVFCRIKYEHERLSICGVVGPLPSGDALGSCGQIKVGELEFTKFAEGWNQQKVEMLQTIWDKYHLNNLIAGSPAQELYLDNNPISDHMNHYDIAVERLTAAGLNPDPNYQNPMTGEQYRYGSAWLRKEVPEWALQWLSELPNTDVEPAWV